MWVATLGKECQLINKYVFQAAPLDPQLSAPALSWVLLPSAFDNWLESLEFGTVVIGVFTDEAYKVVYYTALTYKYHKPRLSPSSTGR